MSKMLQCIYCKKNTSGLYKQSDSTTKPICRKCFCSISQDPITTPKLYYPTEIYLKIYR